MRPLSALELLKVWEQGRDRNPVCRAMMILLAACPEMSEKAVLELSIGQRDKSLLTLREWTFGPQIIGLATCPNCEEKVELSFNAGDIIPGSEAGCKEELLICEEGLVINVDNFEVSFRLPNCRDLLCATVCKDISDSLHQLTEQCILEARHEGKEISAKALPEYVVEAAANQMAELDPGADILLELTCPSCTHSWHAPFDIVSYLWAEINNWAYRTLNEVHIIASAYGWKETDILAMSPWRRQLYLEMIGR